MNYHLVVLAADELFSKGLSPLLDRDQTIVWLAVASSGGRGRYVTFDTAKAWLIPNVGYAYLRLHLPVHQGASGALRWVQGLPTLAVDRPVVLREALLAAGISIRQD